MATLIHKEKSFMAYNISENDYMSDGDVNEIAMMCINVDRIIKKYHNDGNLFSCLHIALHNN